MGSPIALAPLQSKVTLIHPQCCGQAYDAGRHDQWQQLGFTTAMPDEVMFTSSIPAISQTSLRIELASGWVQDVGLELSWQSHEQVAACAYLCQPNSNFAHPGQHQPNHIRRLGAAFCATLGKGGRTPKRRLKSGRRLTDQITTDNSSALTDFA
jgi:hypothetical protein